jgi:hypothetical protein
MFKHEATAQVGDTIRSYDFRGNDAHIEGTVIAKGWIKHPVHGYDMYKGYTIEIEKDTLGNGNRVGDVGYVPFETDFMEYDERVELVKEGLTA